MNTRTLALLALLTLSACGKANTPDPVIQGLVNDFVSDAGLHGRTLTVDTIIVFGDVKAQGGETNAAGVCNVGPNGGTITLDSTYWNRVGDWSKKILLYHELGHCVLGRVHTTEMVEVTDIDNYTQSAPASIMYPSNLMPIASDAYNQALVDELFK